MTRRPFRTKAYRYPRERFILALTLIAVLLVILITATATVCLSFVFVLAVVALSYAATRSHHQSLMERAVAVSPRRAPRLAALVEETVNRLQPGPVQVFVAPHEKLNAYTFGLSAPKVLVLHSALLEVMDEDELRFVLGHELGHVALGHTWLNSLVGGMAGIPSPFVASVLLSMAFLWWNRACEFSADRAGLLACGDPQRAITALTKLTIGRDIRSPVELERALRHVDAEDDHVLSGLGEALSTHPMTIRRIEQLQRYAASHQYRQLRVMMGGIGDG